MKITKRSAFTGKHNTMDLPVSVEKLMAWENSAHVIQQFFPELTDDQREFLLTGVTPDEWDSCMGDESDYAF